MLDNKILKQIAGETACNKSDVEDVLEKIFDILKSELRSKKICEIEDFGTFRLLERRKVVDHFINGKFSHSTTEEYFLPHFTPAASWLNKLNGGV